MNIQIFVVLVVVLAFGLFLYSQYSWRGKVLCLFRRPNRTVIEKRVPLRSRYVIFDGGKYEINPKRIDLMWYTRGMIHQMFPMFVPFLEYKWDMPYALDPTKFTNSWDSPEARNSSKTEEKIRAVSKGFAAQGASKQSTLEKLLPWAAVGISIIVGFMVYQLSQHVSVLEELIKVQR